MYDNRYESHVMTGMTQELTFGRVLIKNEYHIIFDDETRFDVVV